MSHPHPLDSPVRVGERPILFRERSRWQEDIRKRTRLVDEQILHDEEFEMRHVLARLVEVWLRHHRILAHDEQCTHATLMCVPKNFSGGEAELARKTARFDVPCLLPFFRVSFIIHAHVTGVMEWHGTHVAGTLNIVLPTQRIQTSAVAPDMTGE